MGKQPPRSKWSATAASDPALAGESIDVVSRGLLTPHSGGQDEVLADETRFEIVCAGRRWGKTKVAARKLIRSAIRNPGTLNWWVANTYKNVGRGYREVLGQIPKELLAKPAPSVNSINLTLELTNGSRLEFYSGGSPDALAGAGVDFVIMDEAALTDAAVWEQLIRPTLMDSKGHAMMISTPRGHNWFWKLYHYGQDPAKPEYKSWRFTSYDNPYIADSEIDEMRETLPDIVYRQEALAEFTSSAASIFAVGTDGVVVEDLVDPHGNVFVGVDLGKKEDWTVISACREEDRMPCYHEKFNEIRWSEQQPRIIAAVEELQEAPGVENVVILIDSTGIGDVVVDNLEDLGLQVVAVNFSGVWKERAVRLLAADISKGHAHILADQVVEFESYEFELTDAGRYKFAAATGHDDEVSAKLLEHWGLIHEGAPEAHFIDTAKPADVVVKGGKPDAPAAIMARPEAWR